VSNSSSVLDLILNISVTGDGTEKVGGFVDKLKSIAGDAGGGALGKSIEGVTNGWDAIGGKMGGALMTMDAINGAAAHMVQLLDNVADVGRGMMDWGIGGLETLFGMPMELLGATQQLESGFLRMKALSQGNEEAARAAMRASEMMVRYTPYQEHQIMGLATALKAGKVQIDAFKNAQGEAITLGEIQANGLAKVDKQAMLLARNMEVSPISVMADLAASFGQTGVQMDAFVRGVERALATGNVTLLRDQLPHEVLQQVFGGTGKLTKDGSEIIDDMYKYLLKKNQIGMAAAASATFGGIMSNLEEMPMLLSKAIVGDPSSPDSLYAQLRDQLGTAVGSLADIISDPEWQEGIRQGIGPIVKMIGNLTAQFAKGVAVVVEFLGKHPFIVKIGLALFAVASAAALFGGAMLVVGATLATAVVSVVAMAASAAVAAVAFKLFAATMWAAVAPMLIIALKAIAIAAAVGLVVVAVAALTAGLAYLWYKFGGGSEVIQNTLTLFGALWEALQNWGDGVTSISEDTAFALKKGGMLGWFSKMVRWIQEGKNWWDSFSNSVIYHAQRAWYDTLLPAFKAVGRALGDLWHAGKIFAATLGLIQVETANVNNEFDISYAGEFFGTMIEMAAEGVAMFAALLRHFIGFVRGGIEWGAKFADLIDWAIIQPAKDAMAVFEAAKAAAEGDFTAGKLIMMDRAEEKTMHRSPSEMAGETLAKLQSVEDKLAGQIWGPGDREPHPMDSDPMFGGGGAGIAGIQHSTKAQINNKTEVTLELDGEVLTKKVIENVKETGELNYET